MASFSALSLALAILFCVSVFGFSDDEKQRMGDEVAKIYKNAQFQLKFATVAVDTEVYGAQNYELKEAKTPEQKECIRKATQAAIGEGRAIADDIVGKMVPKAAAAQEAAEAGNWDAVAEFLNNVNYEAFKKTSIHDLKTKLMAWVPEKQKEMEACKA